MLVEEDDCLPMPENISDHIGSLLEPLAIGYGIAEMADIQPGDKVLITGCGIIASMVARWAKYRGASYIAMTEISRGSIFPRSVLPCRRSRPGGQAPGRLRRGLRQSR